MSVQVAGFTDDQTFPFWYLRKLMAGVTTAGVASPGDLTVSPSSGLQVQVSEGLGFVAQTVNIEGSSAYNGLYMSLNDGAASPYNTISAPISNPRIDQVILRVYDVKEQGLSGSSKAQFEWLEGTENASASLATMGPGLSNPGADALPSNSLQLAYVLQAVGESSISSGNILNVAPVTGRSWLSNRVQVSSGANISMASGTVYESLGGNPTFSLPPAKMESVVGVVEGGGSGAITVQSLGGAVIHGTGIANGATSFVVGSPGNSVILWSDGVQWFIVAGQQDTGWQPLTIDSGFDSLDSSGYTPAARVVGNMVELRGALQSLGTSTTGPWANVPTSAQPTKYIRFAAPIRNSAQNVATSSVPAINSSGQIVNNGGSIASGDILYLDGLRYSLS